jgi:hypothetical protein
VCVCVCVCVFAHACVRAGYELPQEGFARPMSPLAGDLSEGQIEELEQLLAGGVRACSSCGVRGAGQVRARAAFDR